MPASSMCSITPPMTTRALSRRPAHRRRPRSRLEELVDQDRLLGRRVHGLGHVAVERRRRRRRSPWPGRPARTTGAPAPGSRSLAATSRASSRRGRHAVRRLRDAELPQQLAKRSRSSARSMASGDVPRICTPASCSASARFSGVWPPNCTTHATSRRPDFSRSITASTSSSVSGSK